MKKCVSVFLCGLMFVLFAKDITASEDYLILINAQNPLSEDYYETYKEDFVDVHSTRKDGRAIQKMRSEAGGALDAMLSAAADAGYGDISVTSAYRSRAYQKELFDRAVEHYISCGMTKKEALLTTKRYYAVPGSSEHESGLSADIHHLSCASVSFADTPEYLWLVENAHRYGYILRYPQGKEAITGIAFEPWHFRYVGRTAAEEIYSSGLCLEEYLMKKS